MDEKEFKTRFNDRVLAPLLKTCTLLDIKYNVIYLDEEFTNIINVVLFYTGYYKIKYDNQLQEIYCFQMDIAVQCLKDFYRDFVKENLDIKENDDIYFYRLSDMNFNTAIFFGGDNFDGFNITLTEE